MNKERMNGAIDEIVGVTKRKAGELTGDTYLQVKGVAQQVKGKVESAWGKAKDAAEQGNKQSTVEHDPHV